MVKAYRFSLIQREKQIPCNDAVLRAEGLTGLEIQREKHRELSRSNVIWYNGPWKFSPGFE